ncbi:hypothetical protein ACWC2T_08015 [Streptomyces sp. NPDC001393]
MTDATENAIAEDYAARFPAGGRHPLDRTVITPSPSWSPIWARPPWPTWAAAPDTSPHCCASWASRPSVWTYSPPW